jgi:hypothetical protein
MSVPAAIFGPGIAIVTRTDIANGTPLNVGYVQELSIDLAGSTKPLFGQNQYPLVQARSTIKASGKFKNAVLSGLVMNSVFLGQSLVTGGFDWNIQEAGTATASSYTVTHAASFDQDLGVNYSVSGLPLQKVSAGPASGQYSVSAGVYTFSASDSGTTVLVNYTNTDTGSGVAKQSITVANKLIGTTPTFQLDYYTNLNQPSSEPFAIRVFACVASKLTLAFKLEDYMMPEFDFEIFANASGNIFETVFPSIS